MFDSKSFSLYLWGAGCYFGEDALDVPIPTLVTGYAAVRSMSGKIPHNTFDSALEDAIVTRQITVRAIAVGGITIAAIFYVSIGVRTR